MPGLANPSMRRRREAANSLREIIEHLVKKVVILGGSFPLGGRGKGGRHDFNFEDCRNIHDLLKKYTIQELSPFVEAYLRLHPEVKEEVEGLSFEEKLQLSLPGGDLLVFGKIARFLIRVLAPFLLCVYVLRDPF